MDATFNDLIDEALQQAMVGWDWTYIATRWQIATLSWDYSARVRQLLPGVQSLLDMGTGGGELLSSFAPLPPGTWATEAYAPNLPIAETRLGPLGVRVVAPPGDEQLPFADNTFDLVINRHESFSAPEVYRILKPGGRFLTQQVGGQDNSELNQLLQDEPYFAYAKWSLAAAAQQLVDAGFTLVQQTEEFPATIITDVGAIVFYLRATPWQIEDFAVDRYRTKLAQLHARIQQSGPLQIHSHRFLIEAVKPGP